MILGTQDNPSPGLAKFSLSSLQNSINLSHLDHEAVWPVRQHRWVGCLALACARTGVGLWQTADCRPD